tara:strand:+ start:8735 stop:10909 length:2175 start_codon:yes stop_codon:yes gene_type:complete
MPVNFYQNIFVTEKDLSVNVLESNFGLLDYFNNHNNDKTVSFDEQHALWPDGLHPVKYDFSLNYITFANNPSNRNVLNMNMKTINNVNKLNITGILAKSLSFDFKRDISFNNLRFKDFYNNDISFNLYNNSFTSFDASNVTSIDISSTELYNNNLIFNFDNLRDIPTYLLFDRYISNNIFTIGTQFLDSSAILKHKIQEHFDVSYIDWKDISIDISDGLCTIIDLSNALYESKNILNTKIFSSTNSPLELDANNTYNFTINFNYHGFYENMPTNYANYTDVSFIDISTACVTITELDISSNIYLSEAIYFDICSNLFNYLNILFNESDISTNSIGEKAIRLPLGHDVSFNFTFKPYKSIDTDIHYSLSDIRSGYINQLYKYNNINNLCEIIPFDNSRNSSILYDVSDVSAQYNIILDNIPIINIHNSNAIYRTYNGNEINIDSIKSLSVDCSNLDISNITIDNSYNNTNIIDCSYIYTNSIYVSSIQNDISYINANIIETSFCDISLGTINSNNTQVFNECSFNQLYVLKSFDISNSIINCNSNDISFAHLLTYNNKNLIDCDKDNNIIIGISGDITNRNVDISGILNITSSASALDAAAAKFITLYSAIINTCNVSKVTITSDDRYKHNETDISNALLTINDLKPKKYIKDDIYDAGYIAQEVSLINELNHLVKLNNNIYSINYNGIQPYLVKALQELHSKIIHQHYTISQLFNEIEVLENNT